MKIKKMISQYKRDFTALMQCEFCKHEETNNSGYDDQYYHQNVIPNMKCKSCNKSTISQNGIIDKTQTKYPEWFKI